MCVQQFLSEQSSEGVGWDLVVVLGSSVGGRGFFEIV